MASSLSYRLSRGGHKRQKGPLRIVWVSFFLVLLITPAFAQDPMTKPIPYSASGDAALVSKYIWRGQRLTNDWSLQPSGTFSIGGFSANIWGNLDLTAVNEGDSLLLPQNPAAPPGASGLQGKFSEIDYTLSYTQALGKAVTLDVGSIIYTFPDRSASLPSTTEIYGGLTFDTLPLAPSATLYVDVDETRANGQTGLYFLLGAGHSLPLGHRVFQSLDLSGSLAFANEGFGNYYYGAGESGAHDANLTISLPMILGERWSGSFFVAYSGLLGGAREFQFQDPRDLYRGTAGSPATFADTVWGGVSLSIAF